MLAGLELVDASLELLDSLPHGCEIARHRLEQLHRFGRQGGGGRHDALRCDLSQRLLVVEVLPTPRSPERQVAPVARGAPDFRASAIKSG